MVENDQEGGASLLVDATTTTTLSNNQERILSILSIISACLSICGSSLIIGRIVRCKSYIGSPYNRIMLGLSISDIISSFAAGFGVFLLPKETSPRAWAFGNETTCNMLGFLTQLAIGAVWYNGLLSLYYLFTVRFGVKRKSFASKYEVWFHLSAIFYFFATGVAGLIIDLYGELEITQNCWVTKYPQGCEATDTCKSSNLLGLLFGGFPLLLVFVGLPINNLLIYCHVRKTIRAPMEALSKNMTKEDTVVEDESTGRIQSSSPPMFSLEWETLQKDRLQEVATQGFLYVVFFYVAYLPTFLIRMLDGFALSGEDESDIYWLLVFYSALLPLQGWFNLFIYMRPNYTRVRKVCPDLGIWWAMKVAWWERRLPTLEQTHTIIREIQKQSTSGGTPSNQMVSPTKGESTLSPSKRKRTVEVPSNMLFRESSSGADGDQKSMERKNSRRLPVEPKRISLDTEAQADAFSLALSKGLQQSGIGEQRKSSTDDPYYHSSIPFVDDESR